MTQKGKMIDEMKMPELWRPSCVVPPLSVFLLKDIKWCHDITSWHHIVTCSEHFVLLIGKFLAILIQNWWPLRWVYIRWENLWREARRSWSLMMPDPKAHGQDCARTPFCQFLFQPECSLSHDMIWHDKGNLHRSTWVWKSRNHVSQPSHLDLWPSNSSRILSQVQPPYQILGPYITRFSRERADRQTHRQTGPILYPRQLIREGMNKYRVIYPGK